MASGKAGLVFGSPRSRLLSETALRSWGVQGTRKDSTIVNPAPGRRYYTFISGDLSPGAPWPPSAGTQVIHWTELQDPTRW